MAGWTFRRVVPDAFDRPGGLAWDGGRLLVSLPRQARVVAVDPASGGARDFRRYTGSVGALAFGPGGRLFGCQPRSRRVVCIEPDGSATVPAERLDGRIHNHPADLTVGPGGAIWFSDPIDPRGRPGFFPFLDHASVLALVPRPDGGWDLRRATDDTRRPGAIQVSRDGARVCVAECPPPETGLPSELRAYEVAADGRLGRPRPLLSFAPGGGWVRSLALDAGGDLLAGVCGLPGEAPAIWVLTAHGERAEVHPLPGEAAGIGFGGAAGNDLFVLTGDGALWVARDLPRSGWLPYLGAGARALARPRPAGAAGEGG